VGKAAGSVVAEDGDMSFDNAYFTHTYYVINAEHRLRAQRAEQGVSPGRGRRLRRRHT
jgi:hypothetical protein